MLLVYSVCLYIYIYNTGKSVCGSKAGQHQGSTSWSCPIFLKDGWEKNYKKVMSINCIIQCQFRPWCPWLSRASKIGDSPVLWCHHGLKPTFKDICIYTRKHIHYIYLCVREIEFNPWHWSLWFDTSCSCKAKNNSVMSCTELQKVSHHSLFRNVAFDAVFRWQ